MIYQGRNSHRDRMEIIRHNLIEPEVSRQLQMLIYLQWSYVNFQIHRKLKTGKSKMHLIH